MAAAGGGAPPPIIRRRKVVAGAGHHGGAWKVAYADFVTAMMAFFLLMWLLNATTDQQKKGLADYFAPDIPLARVSGGSDGMFGGDAPTSQETMATDGEMVAFGVVGDAVFARSDDGGTAAAEAAEVAALREVEDVLLGRGGESLLSDEALRHVVTRLTDEGLVIELFALPGAPLWEEGSDRPLPVTEELLAVVAEVAGLVTNPVAVSGHLPARPVVLAEAPGLAWDLSARRANAARAGLEAAGLDPARMARVAGHADREPAVSVPASVRNDRVEVILRRTRT